jgi:hypothetical protein
MGAVKTVTDETFEGVRHRCRGVWSCLVTRLA